MGVSRNTIREALKSLENEGILFSRHGVGIFVSSPPAHSNHNITVLNSTTEIIKNNGFTPGTKSVFYEIRKVPQRILDQMTFYDYENTDFLYIERVRTADDKPIAYVEDYIPYFDGLLEQFPGEEEIPFFPFLEREGLEVAFSNCTIHSVLSTPKLEERLSLEKPAALLLLQQLHYSSKGDLVLYSDSYFITNELEFSLVRNCSN